MTPMNVHVTPAKPRGLMVSRFATASDDEAEAVPTNGSYEPPMPTTAAEQQTRRGDDEIEGPDAWVEGEDQGSMSPKSKKKKSKGKKKSKRKSDAESLVGEGDGANYNFGASGQDINEDLTSAALASVSKQVRCCGNGRC